MAAAVTKAAFGKLPDGTAIDIYTLKNAELTVRITNYGARIVSLATKDRDGKMGDVVLGYDSVEGYVAEEVSKTYVGAIVGRYGNRIRDGKFSIDGHQYQIPLNNGANALHGGPHGFDDQVLDGQGAAQRRGDDAGVEGRRHGISRHADAACALHAGGRRAAHQLHGDDRQDDGGECDQPRLLQPGGRRDSGTILDEVMQINADEYTPVDAGLIPVGGVKPVAGTPFDFNKPTAIGARINEPNEQLKFGGGYDHNWILRGKPGEMKVAARVVDPKTGRVLTVETTEPGVQFYSGNAIPGLYKGKTGVVYGKYAGFCLETQHYPDSPNQPAFPSTLLKPGETMRSETVYAFSVQK